MTLTPPAMCVVEVGRVIRLSRVMTSRDVIKQRKNILQMGSYTHTVMYVRVEYQRHFLTRLGLVMMQ